VAVSKDFHAYVIEQLSLLGSVTSRRMFGGVGLYADDLFFGLIDDDTLYLKVDDTNRSDFVERGAKPFCPFPDKSEFSMNYFDVPADILDDIEGLSLWARKSLNVAVSAASKKARSKSKSSKRLAKTRPKKKIKSSSKK
jgi:DNA transformation protein